MRGGLLPYLALAATLALGLPAAAQTPDAPEAASAKEPAVFAKAPALKPLRLMKLEKTPQSVKSGAVTFRLAPRSSDPAEGGRVEILLGGKAIWTRKVEPQTVLLLVDINRDGLAEAVVDQFSGGAHCCHSNLLLQVNPKNKTVRTLLDWNGQEAALAGAQFRMLSRGKYAEILTYDCRFRYFDDLPFSDSPLTLKIFTYKGGSYIPATAMFPDAVHGYSQGVSPGLDKKNGEVKLARENLAKAPDSPDAQMDVVIALHTVEGAALELYVYGVLLDEKDQVLRNLGKSVDPDVLTWLQKHAPGAERLIRQEPY